MHLGIRIPLTITSVKNCHGSTASTARPKQEKVHKSHRLKRNKTVIIDRLMYVEHPKDYTDNMKMCMFNWVQNQYIKINFISIYHNIFKIKMFKSFIMQKYHRPKNNLSKTYARP